VTRPPVANPFRLFFLVALLAVVLLPSAAVAGLVTQLTTNTTEDLNMDAAVDVAGNIHVVYERAGNVYYRGRTGTTWSAEELVAAGTSPAVGAGDTGVPQAAFLSGGLVKFSARLDGTWTPPVDVSPVASSAFDMAVDSGGVAHVTFLANTDLSGDSAGYVDLNYTSKAATSPTFPPSPLRIWSSWYYYDGWGRSAYYYQDYAPVIAVDSDGNYAIAYNFRWINGGGGFNDWGTSLHVYQSATNTDASTADYYKGYYPAPRRNALAVGIPGQAFLAFGTTLGTALGTSWIQSPLPSGSAHALQTTSDPALHVAYVNGTNGIEYAVDDTGTGFAAPLVLSTTTSGRNPSVVVAGEPFVAYEASDGDYEVFFARTTNAAPVLDPIGDRQVDEGLNLTFTVTASDADGDTLTYGATPLPAGATFSPASGDFTWTPTYAQAGFYEVTFQVGDGTETASETVTITVTNVNRMPELGSIGDRSVDENSNLSFTVTASDPDGDPLAVSASPLPDGATFDPGTGLFSWTPTYDQAGEYHVTFEAGDGEATASETILINVWNVDRPPVLEPIGPKSVDENVNLSFVLAASDPDGDTLTFEIGNQPDGATFDFSTGAFSWTPTYDKAGAHEVTFRVTDGDLSDSETITITVNNINRAPVMDTVQDQGVAENSTLTFTVWATDQDGETLTYGASSLPTGASFDPATRTFSWTPTYEQAGTHPGVTFTVADPVGGTDSETITIEVYDVNRAPVLAPIGAQAVDENATLSFTVSAIDPDEDDLVYGALNLPTGAAFDPATRTFSWTPTYSQAGTYANVAFGVADDGTPPLNDYEAITITVNDVNRAPVLAAIGDKSVDEGATLGFTLSASDGDGDGVTFSATNLPTGATLNPATGAFSWTPTHEQSGSYPGVVLTATDDGTPGLSDSETITITVDDVNAPPVLAAIGDRSVSEGATLSFTVSASDVDPANTLTFSASNLPTGAAFDRVTRAFSWTPDHTQAGAHAGVVFTVTDDGTPSGNDSETITITVDNVNRAPVLGAIGDKSVTEGDTLTFTVSATDEDGGTLTYSASNLPAGATFDPATRVFSWRPGYEQSGDYPAVVFAVADAEASDSETITIAVADNPVPPGFFTVTPCRLIDTRNAAGEYGGPAIEAGTDRTFDIVSGACGIPATASAISVNVTVTGATAAGNLRLFPADVAAPGVSTINYVAGVTRANNAIVRLSELGEIAVRVAPSGSVHFILDVNGYFQEAIPGDR
jgi:hypothetical protein